MAANLAVLEEEVLFRMDGCRVVLFGQISRQCTLWVVLLFGVVVFRPRCPARRPPAVRHAAGRNSG